MSGGETFLGIIHRVALHFKTTLEAIAPYLARGRKPFQPKAKRRLKHYSKGPPEVVANAEDLEGWAGLGS